MERIIKAKLVNLGALCSKERAPPKIEFLCEDFELIEGSEQRSKTERVPVLSLFQHTAEMAMDKFNYYKQWMGKTIFIREYQKDGSDYWNISRAGVGLSLESVKPKPKKQFSGNANRELLEEMNKKLDLLLAR